MIYLITSHHESLALSDGISVIYLFRTYYAQAYLLETFNSAMEPCLTASTSPIRACHNCRRGRRRCDRSLPTCTKCSSTGQACLGYGELLLWTNSVASRGKMAGKTFAATGASEMQHIAPCVNSTNLAVRFKTVSPDEGNTVLPFNPKSSWCWQLSDPFFQDLSGSSQFYLSYCKCAHICKEAISGSLIKDDKQVCKDLVLHDIPKQNPFRDLLLLSSDYPLLQQIILANSALRLSNATGESPWKRDARAGPSLKAYKDALVAKHRALRLLSEALANKDSINPDVVLAAIMLFIKFELLDSGINGWRFHTEGARQLMMYLRQSGKSELPALNSLRNCLISNCAT
jgi:hypothetical protein